MQVAAAGKLYFRKTIGQRSAQFIFLTSTTIHKKVIRHYLTHATYKTNVFSPRCYPGEDASFYDNPMKRNALMLLKMILCDFGQICATVNALMQLEMISCEFGRIFATGKALCSWKRFYASLDGSVQQEILWCSWKRFDASLDRSVPQGILSLTNCWQELHFEFSRQN